jgi:hypothetical protein
MLGHTSAKVTRDTYADLFDDDLDAVATSLHARYSREVTRKCAQNVPTKRSECYLANGKNAVYLHKHRWSFGGGGGI